MEDYEKKYKEALATAKDCLKDGTITSTAIDYISTIFPELKESEDERVKKRILLSLEKDLMATKNSGCDTQDLKQCIAWLEKQGESYTKKDVDDAYLKGICDAKHELEKQGEQKPAVVDFNAKDWYVSKVDGKIHDMTYNPADKVEPRFKVGDYIVSDYCMGRIVEITNDAYLLDAGQGIPFSCENNVHLWTIDDAKDGDVLACGDKVTDCPFIYHNLTEELNPRSYCGVNMLQHFQDNDENGGFWCHSDEVRPSTKEQRDLLFQKMKEAGYEWDSEKLELKKIEDEIEIPFGAKDSKLQEATYYIPKGFHAEIDDDKVIIKKGEKPTEWSDEDENYLQSAENACEYQYGKNTSTILWLKSLKERITWKPSKEQIEALDDALNERGFDYNYLNSLYEQLKKL